MTTMNTRQSSPFPHALGMPLMAAAKKLLSRPTLRRACPRRLPRRKIYSMGANSIPHCHQRAWTLMPMAMMMTSNRSMAILMEALLQKSLMRTRMVKILKRI